MLAYCVIGEIAPLISQQVIEEANRNIAKQFPLLLPAWQSFLLIPPEVVQNPTTQQVTKAYTVLPTSDAPILASAIKARPDYLITWNTKDFLRSKVLVSVTFPILTPGDFLAEYRS